MSDYGSIYRAKAVSYSAPRLTCYVPQVFGDVPIEVLDFIGPAIPGMGWVFFNGGHAEHPVWIPDIGADAAAVATAVAEQKAITDAYPAAWAAADAAEAAKVWSINEAWSPDLTLVGQSTGSTTYVNWPNPNCTVSLTRAAPLSDVVVTLHGSAFTTVQGGVDLAVNVNGTDHFLGRFFFNNINTHLTFSYESVIPAASIPAGTWTFTVRTRMSPVGGTTSFNTDANDYYRLHVRERLLRKS